MGSSPPDPLAAETELVSLLGRPELSSQLLETVPGGVVVVSLAGGVMHANAEAQRLLGLTYESLTGRYVTDWATQTFREDGSPCPPEDYPVTLCLQSGERQGPTTIGIESPEGEVTWCVFMAVPLHAPREGHLLGAVVSFLDVTSRRQVEQDLRVSEARYRSLVRHIQDTVIIIDRDERILFINNVTVGFSLEDLLGTSIRNFMPDPSVLDGHSEKVFQEGQATVYETDASNGRWYRSHLMPLERDAEGTVLTAMLIASDVTESRREEEDRHRLEADLARRVSELNVLAGGIAHDFNNVLQGILGSAELAMRLLPEDHELRSHLEDIRTDARHAGDLTHQLLAYSGRGQVCIEPLDLEELLTSMWRLVRANVSRRAKLTLALEGDLGVVEGDATQLRQVVMNLATNASEALGGGEGAIAISTGRITLAEAQTQAVWALAEPFSEHYLLLEVRDEGSGMDESVRRRVFDPFFSTKSRSGRGLGLAAVYGIVRAHRGALAIDSTPGAGTTIRVFLPESTQRAPTSEEVRALAPAPRSHTGRILLVEDEDRPRRVARLALESAGYEVLTAATGSAARAILTKEHASLALALVDLVLPDADGAELIAEIRELDPQLPVVACSGYQEETFSVATRDFLAAFLTKPFVMDDLLLVVGKARR